MQKGMVMEVSRRHYVVLTPEGRFIKVPKQDAAAEIGQEITFELEKQFFLPLNLPRKAILAGGVAAMMVIMTILLPLMWAPTQAHAETYIYIDLNPSLELGLDKKSRVVEVRAFNSTGEQLIQELDWKGVPAKRLVVQLLNRARQQGYLEPNERILVSQIAIEPKDAEVSRSTLSEIEESIGTDTELSQSKVDLYTLPLPDMLKAEAEKNDLSPSKYAVWLLAKRNGLDLPPEELVGLSMTELMELVDLTPILRNPPSKEEWEEWIQEEKEIEQENEKDQSPSDKEDEKEEEQIDSPADEPSDKDEQDVEEGQEPEEEEETPKNDSSDEPAKEDPSKENPASTQPDSDEEENESDKPESEDPSKDPPADPEREHGPSAHSNHEELSLE
ncbi:anti-sigma factor domain-containing protein [Desmospora activa]|uniref:Anti-sigma factor-like protein n=1 Tax=Desmospora activa DSM 45169 TaxID=1121389 RepID=A0A2T4ZD57_9BACL|nr:anti-sigma factor domain-containing protein [Desmospora activa]PTM59825.1 anti-sigma factor-like protein [Desmospora activa DSM 45169]